MRLNEFNHCHSKADGRFCSDAGGPVARGGPAGRPGAGRPIPIRASSIDEAVGLILQGKVVELAETRQINTVLSKLAAMALDAKSRGQEAPNYDLCKVSVAGTNLFCASRFRDADHPGGIPRISMPQIGGRTVPGSAADKLRKAQGGGDEVDGSEAFISYLESKGIKVERTSIAASQLKASQAELVGPKVAGMMSNTAYDPSAKPIFASRDHYVIDGHHRWAAVVGRDAADGRLGDLRMKTVTVDAPISEILPLANAWAKQFGIAPKAAKKSRAKESMGRLTPQSNSEGLGA